MDLQHQCRIFFQSFSAQKIINVNHCEFYYVRTRSLHWSIYGHAFPGSAQIRNRGTQQT